jgi:hypothetical protein
MFRDRLRAWIRVEPAAAKPDVPVASAIACLYRHWCTAGDELVRLSRGLSHQRFEDGLRALERACACVRIADELVEVIALATPEHASEPSAANKLRRELLAEILPWLETARSQLSGATSMLCEIAKDAASREAVLAALRQLVHVQVPQPQPQRRKAGP